MSIPRFPLDDDRPEHWVDDTDDPDPDTEVLVRKVESSLARVRQIAELLYREVTAGGLRPEHHRAAGPCLDDFVAPASHLFELAEELADTRARLSDADDLVDLMVEHLAGVADREQLEARLHQWQDDVDVEDLEADTDPMTDLIGRLAAARAEDGNGTGHA